MIQGRTMGTAFSVKFRSLSPHNFEKVREEIQKLVDHLDGLMSTYRSDSEVCRFASHRDTNWFEVSPETARVIDEAQRISEETEGAFDVTIDPLVRLWGFGPERIRDKIPSDPDISAAKRHVDFRKLHVRLDPPSLRKDDPELTIDLSAIAKGFAVDAIAERLDQLGITNYLIAISGEIRARGRWPVGIEKPVDDGGEILRSIELDNRAVSTSGDYRNFFIVGGRRYSHEIDPRTGMPVSNGDSSVTVLEATSTRADALATALMVMGPEAGFAFAEASHLPCMFVLRNGPDVEQKTTSEFEAASKR